MLIVSFDDGERLRFYKMSQKNYEALIDKSENFGVQIDCIEEGEIPIADENEVLNDFGSLGL